MELYAYPKDIVFYFPVQENDCRKACPKPVESMIIMFWHACTPSI